MFLRRMIDHLKTQNWTAVGLDLGIVIVGVFIGTQVANWNQARIEKRETERLLLELRPALNDFTTYFDSATAYYGITRRYSDTAFAGWRHDPSVTDEQFVIAAYQASQIFTFGVNGENWTSIFGGERLLDIDNEEVRRRLTALMTFNYEGVDLPAISTPYRQHVRSIIPVDIQDAIRAECGDRPNPANPAIFYLPETCSVAFTPAQFASGAAALRAHPELADELRGHRAAVAAFLANAEAINGLTRQLQQSIGNSAS